MGIGAGLLQAAVAADDKPAMPPPPAQPPTVPQGQQTLRLPPGANAVRPGPPVPRAPEPLKLLPGFKDLKEQMSYSVGVSIAQTIKQGMIDLDMDVLTAAMKDFMTGSAPKLTDEQVNRGVQGWRTAAGAKREEERVKTAEKNRKLGDAFLAENKKKEGVKTHAVTLPGGQTAEMQYKIITEGTGAIPKSNDVVTVRFRGTTINGKEFDNSSKRGPNPVRIMVSRASYKGWGAAWQMMKVGSKWELYLPSTLGGGDFPVQRVVEPGSTLIYEMELVSIEAPPAPRASTPAPPGATNAPLTSEIIKVPSAEEIKKGAQPKIMTPADIEKEMQNAKKQ